MADQKIVNQIKSYLADAKKVYLLQISLKDEVEFPSIVLMELIGSLSRTENIITTVPDIFQGNLDRNLKENKFFIESKKGEQEFLNFIKILLPSKKEVELFDVKLLTHENFEKIWSNESEKPEKFELAQTGKQIKVNLDELYQIGDLVERLNEAKSSLNLLFSNIDLSHMGSDARLVIDEFRSIEKKYTLIIKKVAETVNNLKIDSVAKLFAKTAKIATNLAKETGKKVELKISGSEVKIDKIIIEYLYDTLMHIIRNAVDHGIEKSDIRLKKGKPETGIIELNAFEDPKQIIIEIRDDGSGINLNEVKKKALKLNIATEQELDAMSEEQLLNFVFYPSFSTAKELSSVSGRGIGLDVVKTNITIIGGKITIKSKQDGGTWFTLLLPQDVAKAIVKIDKEREKPAEEDYNLCLSEIDEILEKMDGCLERLNTSSKRGEIYHDLFRHAHTIKGLAGFLGEESIVSISHRLEDILDYLVQGKLEINEELNNMVTEAVDVLNGLVASMTTDLSFGIDEQIVIRRMEAILDAVCE